MIAKSITEKGIALLSDDTPMRCGYTGKECVPLRCSSLAYSQMNRIDTVLDRDVYTLEMYCQLGRFSLLLDSVPEPLLESLGAENAMGMRDARGVGVEPAPATAPRPAETPIDPAITFVPLYGNTRQPDDLEAGFTTYANTTTGGD